MLLRASAPPEGGRTHDGHGDDWPISYADVAPYYDIHAAFDSPTGLIYPALDPGRLTLRTGSIAREVTVDPGTGKARGVAFLHPSGAAMEAKGRVVVLAASTRTSTKSTRTASSSRSAGGLSRS